jgi:hypothetical protein
VADENLEVLLEGELLSHKLVKCFGNGLDLDKRLLRVLRDLSQCSCPLLLRCVGEIRACSAC